MRGQREPERGRDSLMAQVQPWPGARMERECLRPPGEPGPTVSYGYLGDMQLRLVFDEPGQAQSSAARHEDLARLELTPQKAVAHAAANTLCANGAPQVTTLGEGVYALRGAHLEYNATYLLDRAFWRGQLQKFPAGLLAALPRKGALLFCPVGDPGVEEELARQAGRIFAAAGDAAVSACIYRFDAAGWHPHADLPQPVRAELPAKTRSEAPDSQESDGQDLDKAARGQRMLVFSILGGFVVNAMAGAKLNDIAVLAATCVLLVYSLLGVVRLASGLGRSTGATIVFMVLTFVPLVNILTWIVLSMRATRALRAAGWEVGLLGAKG